MNTGQTVFAQLMELLPLPAFRQCVARYNVLHVMVETTKSKNFPVSISFSVSPLPNSAIVRACAILKPVYAPNNLSSITWAFAARSPAAL